MESQSTDELIVRIVSQVLKAAPGTVTAESSMDTVPNWDSLAQLNICMALQEQLNAAMEIDDIAEATSVRALSAVVTRSRTPR